MLRYAIHSIHGVDQSVIVRISDLHLECQKLLLSDLGLPFVVRYFEVCATDPDVVGFYAITDGGDLVGYIVGTARADRLNTRLIKPLGWFIFNNDVTPRPRPGLAFN